jgi:hypothetical protein
VTLEGNRLKRGDIKTRVKDDLPAVVWKDKRNVNVLKNMQRFRAEGNVCDSTAIVQNYKRHMGTWVRVACSTSCKMSQEVGFLFSNITEELKYVVAVTVVVCRFDGQFQRITY